MKAAIVCSALLAMMAGPALAQAPAAPMPIYGVSVTSSAVVVRVPATACVRKSDFEVAVLKRTPQSLVLFSPKHPQSCGAVGPGHTDLTYGLDELGVKPGEGFVLGNPLAAEP
jgi:hypothetical protein